MKTFTRTFLLLTVVCVAISICTTIVACSETEDCSMTGRPMMYCTLYTLDPVAQRAVNDTLDSLTVATFDALDNILINNEKNVHTLMLPLRYTADSTVFVFHYNFVGDPSDADTLVVRHSNTPYFQSMTCGYQMKQSITGLRVGHTSSAQSCKLDSIFVLNAEANAAEIQNLRLFY